MTRVYVFPAGDNAMMFHEYARLFHVSCAVTEHGRMIAGAVSQNEETGLARCLAMARQKAPEMITGETSCEIVNPQDERLKKALGEYFRRMP